MGRRVVEHWWNGLWGTMNRRVIKLLISDEGTWQIYAIGSWGVEGTVDQHCEDCARAQVAMLLDEYGPWKQLTVR